MDEQKGKKLVKTILIEFAALKRKESSNYVNGEEMCCEENT
jgi:hypothetical protein